MSFLAGSPVAFRPQGGPANQCIVGAFVTVEGNSAIIGVSASDGDTGTEITTRTGNVVLVSFVSVNRDDVFAGSPLPPGLTASSELSEAVDPRALCRAYYAEGTSADTMRTAASRAAPPGQSSASTTGRLPTSALMAGSVQPQPPSTRMPTSARPWARVLGAMAEAGDDGDESADDEEESWWDAPRRGRQARGANPLLASAPGAHRGTGASGSNEPAPTSGDINTLVQLEMLKVLKRMQSKRGSDSEGDSGGEGAQPLRRSGTESLTRQRRQLRKNPGNVISKHVAAMKEKLGATDARMVWCPTEYSRRLLPRFGRYKGMWRIHHMVSEILTELLAQKFDLATAMTCQLHKVLLQHAIDGGDWASATLLWGSPDPLGTEDFGGDYAEMEAVHRYRKALADLKQKHRQQPNGEAEEEEDAARPAPKWKPKKKKDGADGGAGK
jgi:hypothetical protein